MFKIQYSLKITRCALVAAIYAALSLVLAPISYGEIQFRVAEVLSLLPFFGFEYVISVTLGCFIANLLGSGYGVIDIVFGTLSTFLAGILSYLLRGNKYLVPLPPVLINSVIVGAVISYSGGVPYLMSAFYVAVGQSVVCYILGLPFITFCSKRNLF